MSFRFLKNRGFWSTVIGLVGIVMTAYTILYKPKKSLKIEVERVVNLLDVRDNGINLKVFLKDSIEINREKNNISIYQVEIRNAGGENIKINDFDGNLGFGFILQNGQILEKPEIVNSSDNVYYSDVLKKVTSTKVSFVKKIIDSGSHYTVKFFVLHDKGEIPKIKSFGRISGQGMIPVSNKLISDTELAAAKKKNNLVLISLLFTLLGFAGLVYAYLKSIKNQKLIAEQKYIIENLLINQEELVKM